MSVLFLTHGTTHSGKTTFGKRLRVTLGESAKFIHVDNDVADEFIRENFNNLRTDKDILATRTPTNPDLRLLIPQLVTDYALREKYSVIATAAHPRLAIRQSYYDIAKKNNAKVVLLIFRVDEALVAKRIQNSERDTAILYTSSNRTFQDVFAKQKLTMEEPTDAEKEVCFRVFEVSPENTDEILDAAAKLVRQEQA